MAQLTPYQLDIITRTILGEARGEGDEGMAAVAHNIRNRSMSGQFPSDPAKVALQPRQYSTWNKGEGGNNPQQFKPGSNQYQSARQLVEEVFGGQRQDPTNGALFYHTPQVNPSWSRGVNKHGTTQIGNHIFYNGRPTPPGEIPNTVASALSVTPETRNVPRPQPRPTTRQPIPATTASTGTSRASMAAPAFAVTPRLATSDGGLFAYNDKEMQQPQFVGGRGSLTPAFQTARTAPLAVPRSAPRQPSASERAALAYVPPPPPTRVALPPIPPSRSVTPNHFGVTQQRVAAASQPALQSALNSRPVTPQQLASVPRSQGQTVATIPTSPTSPRIGQPPATRTVASVPVRPSAPGPMDPIGSMGSFADFQTALGPRIPGPNMPPKLGEERLMAGLYPMPPVPTLPGLPGQGLGVGTALDILPPPIRPITGFPTSAAMRPRPVTGFPSARPMAPMPVQARRPIAPPPLLRQPMQAPLRIVVQADRRPPPPPPNKYMVNGKAVQLGMSNSLAGTSASGFGGDRYDPYSVSTSISG